MAQIPSPFTSQPGFQLARGPWGVYLAALALTFQGYVGVLSGLGAVQAIGIIAGLIAAGSAVAWRLQAADDAFEERIQSACLVFLAGLLAEFDMYLLPGAVAIGKEIAGGLAEGSGAVPTDWGSARMFLRALWIAATVGALLVVLPSLARRILISLLVVFHFGGILTAVTSVEPPGAPAPWLSLQAWTRVYRPYLSFMYLNNAYHFYSPEPGPPTLVWFHVRYADNQAHWVKIPVRKESPVPLHYQRLLALTESTNMVNAQPMTEPQFEVKLRSRQTMGFVKDIKLHPLIAPHNQYREPQPYSKVMLSAYARFAARHFKHLEDPSIPVASVRIYKVTHNIVLASDLAQGYSPLEKTLYMPYYMGEFDPEGDLMDKDDPFLYWLIPIFPEDIGANPNLLAGGPGFRPNVKIVDCLEIHAGGKSPTSDPEKNTP